jgi:hypothetical protein
MRYTVILADQVKAQLHLTIARRFAAALDAEDYMSARALLAEQCVYETGGAVVVGVDAIIESYQTNGKAAQRRFDEIEYASYVEKTGPWSAVIDFTDRVRLGSEWHEFRCRQHVKVGQSGLVEKIKHEDLPNEREQLKEFENRRTKRCTCG